MEVLTGYLPKILESGGTTEVESSSPSEELYVYNLFFDLGKHADASGEVASFNLGSPGSSVTGGVHLSRDKCYWLFARPSYSLPANTDTQILILRGSSHVLVILPLTTESYLGALRGPMFEREQGSVFIRFEKTTGFMGAGKAVAAVSQDINLALKSVVKHARSILRKDASPSSIPTLPENLLTYCTWNSLQPPTPTNAASALEALQHFHSLGVQPASFLIDDGWQHVNSFRTLQEFDSPASFLGEYKNLAEVVKTAKEKCGVRDVGVWHTIQGYWLGVDTSRFSGRYKLVKVTKDGYPGPSEPAGSQYYIPHPDSVESFFRDYYAALHAAGITFTKCDNMASIDHIVSAIEVSFPSSRSVEVTGKPVDVSELRNAYIRAVKTAARESFGAENVIWCMGMTPRLLLGEVGLGGDGIKRTCRNSDDYFPNEQDSHGYHIYANSLNALLLNNLDVRPDFDMFQTHAYISPQGVQTTSHLGLAQASFHALFRVFGTGPVTITDVPGKSDPKILQKIVGSVSPTSTSPSLVVQASEPFTVTNDILESSVLDGGHGKGIKLYVDNTIGIWNVRGWNGKVVEFINPGDIAHALSLPPKSAPPPVVLYIQSSNTPNESRTLLYGSTKPLHPPSPVRVDLDTLGWAVIGVAPIEQEAQVACLGLVDKYLSSRGVEKTELAAGKYTVHARCSGKLGIWIGPDVKIERVSVSLINDGSAKGVEQDAEIETEELAKGKVITVQVKGRSEVVFEVA